MFVSDMVEIRSDEMWEFLHCFLGTGSILEGKQGNLCMAL